MIVKISLDRRRIASLRCQPLHTVTKASLENIVSWSLMDPPHSVAPLSAPPTLNFMGVMQSKCAPSQAFPACYPLWSLPKLRLHFLPRSSSGYILCSSQDTPLVLVFLLSIDPHLRFQKQCRWRWESRGSSLIQLHTRYYIKMITKPWNSRNKI